MSERTIGRWTEYRTLAVSIALVLASGYFVWQTVVGFAVGRLLLAVTLAILGIVGMVFFSFPLGCLRCKAPLELAKVQFSHDDFDKVQQAMSQSPQDIVALANAPVPSSSQRVAHLNLDYCTRCSRNGFCQVTIERINGRKFSTERRSKRIILSPEQMAATLDLLRQRLITASSQPSIRA